MTDMVQSGDSSDSLPGVGANSSLTGSQQGRWLRHPVFPVGNITGSGMTMTYTALQKTAHRHEIHFRSAPKGGQKQVDLNVLRVSSALMGDSEGRAGL